MNYEWVGVVVAAIIGGCIAGFFSLYAIKQTFKNQQTHADENEERLIKALLQAIHDEIETVWNQYQDTMGTDIEALGENKPLNYYYPLISDYFTVYNGNSFLIGRIENDDLRKQIILTYTLAKGMVDSFRLNNDFVSKHELAQKIRRETALVKDRRHVEVLRDTLISYAKKLKARHQTLKAEVNKLLRDLRKHGVLAEPGNR